MSSQHEVLELLNDTILPTVDGQSKLSSQKNVHKPLTMSKVINLILNLFPRV